MPEPSRRRPCPSVAFVLPNGYDLGGVTTWSLRAAGWLRDRGYDVSLLSHESHLPGGIGPVPEGVTDRPVAERAFVPHEGYVRRFTGTYAEALPGVIVPNWSVGAYAAVAALARSHADDLRVIGFGHTDAPEVYDHLAHYEPAIHTFVAVSEEVGAALRARLPHRADDVVVRPYAVPLGGGRSYTPPEGAIRLAYGGRLAVKQKRILDLADLAAALHARGVPFTLDIAGTGPEEAALWARVRALPAAAAAAIRFHGQLPFAEMEAFWKRADVCVLTSTYEGTSISMLEAMARGCVPVVTAVSGTERMIRPGENGYAVPIGDVEALADAVAELAADRDQLAAFGREAAAVAHAVASPEPYVDWLVALVEAVWAKAPRPWPAGRPIHPPDYAYARLPYPVVRMVQGVARRLRRFPRVHGAVRGLYRWGLGALR